MKQFTHNWHLPCRKYTETCKLKWILLSQPGPRVELVTDSISSVYESRYIGGEAFFVLLLGGANLQKERVFELFSFIWIHLTSSGEHSYKSNGGIFHHICIQRTTSKYDLSNGSRMSSVHDDDNVDDTSDDYNDQTIMKISMVVIRINCDQGIDKCPMNQR